MDKTFIKSTSGLKACYGHQNPALVDVEINRIDENTIELQPRAARNLSYLKVGRTLISQTAWENRPHSYYNGTIEAVWALESCGFHVCGVSARD